MRRSRYLTNCTLAWIGLAAALLCARSALAADEGFYVAGSVGASHVQYDTSTYYASTNNVGYEAAVGYKPLSMFAGEIDYDGFPRAFGGPNYVDTYSLGAFALGVIPTPVVQVFGKLGVIDWRTRAQASLPAIPSFHRTGSDLAYGVGAGTSWGRLGARVEFEKFDIAHTSATDLTSIGLVWTL